MLNPPSDFRTILALECSTDLLSLALRTPDGLWQRELSAGAQASSQILQQIATLLQEAHTPWDALELLVCGRGPGAFTGVRVAIAVVQGLAVSRNIPVLPLSGLLAVAEAARGNLQLAQSACEIWAVQDARMGQAYAALCSWDGQSWHLGQELLLDYAEIAKLPETQQIAGNVRQALEVACLPIPAGLIDARPSAAMLLQLEEQALAFGAEVLTDAAALMPIYVRNKVAQTIAERAQAATPL